MPAEGGGLAVVATSGASDGAYGFDPNDDEWGYPGPVGAQREATRRRSSRRDRIPSKKHAMEDKMQGGTKSFSNEADRKRALEA